MRKQKQLIFIILISTIFVGIMIFDFLKTDQYFSETENKILEQRPEITLDTLFDGSFTRSYETYIAEQFIKREEWITLKTITEKLLQKKESNGVYFIADGSFIEKNKKDDFDEKKMELKINALVKETKELSEIISGKVSLMFVPGAAGIWKEKIPLFSDEVDQIEIIEKIEAYISDSIHMIRVDKILEQHKEEEIYYKTDHHWTTLGAFYGYQSYLETQGLNKVSLEEYQITLVSTDFLGTLHSKVNIPVTADEIVKIEPNEKENVSIEYVYENRLSDSFYEESHLATKDQYSYFLDGNHPLIKITTVGEGKKDSILIIKNSYANCLIPFLSKNYKNIHVIDPRYYRSNISEYAKMEQIEDVLYLFDVINYF
ncbi:MAG: DHHW family protein [Lachnospiraceae bacterium]